MAKFKLVIFDLDDVIYSEIDYIKSGFQAVANSISNDKKMQNDLFVVMEKLFKKDPKHVFDQLLKLSELNLDFKIHTKESLIKIYQQHLPRIKLDSKVILLLKKIRDNNIFTAILSDGRENSQKLKIKSLGLESIVDKIILTDSLGSEKKFWKPSSYGFEILLEYFKVEPNQACYIGDNLEKDFEGPKKLGIITILFRNKNGIYYLKKQNNNQCKYVVDSISELERVIFN